MKFKLSDNESYEMPLLGLENVMLHTMGNLSLTFDNDVHCTSETSETSNILIIAVVCGIIVVTTIVGFFITKKLRESKENVAGKSTNNELDDIADMEQQHPIIKQISK